MSQRLQPDWINGYLAFVDRTEPPQLFKLWSAIGTIAAVLRRKTWLEWETTIFPNMYIVLVGPPACRKGTALRPAYELLRDLGITLSADSTTREALIRAIARCQAQDVDPDGGLITTHASLTIFSPELTVFMDKTNERLISDLNDWYDCRDVWTYDTKNQGTDAITNIWVNLIGATTPRYLCEAMPETGVGGGFASRVIFVYGDRIKPCAVPFQTAEEEAIRSDLQQDLERIAALHGPFTADESYMARYVPWYEALHARPPFDEDDPIFSHYNGRRSLHLRKLSMIISASRSDSMVLTEKDFDRAERILVATEKQMPFAFSATGRAPKVDVYKAILKHIAISRTTTEAEILRRYESDINSRELEEMIATMLKIGHISRVIKDGQVLIKWVGRGESKA